MFHGGIISQLWDRVRTSLWFVPGLMALGALLLAYAALALDRAVSDSWIERLPLVFSGRPAGARAVLSTVATSMIGTAGVVFSMTIVSLQLASSQFGPRLLRTFLRDRGNQVVLGTFVGIFLYCILVLPTIDGTTDSAFVPHIAVTIALLLAVVGLAMLVYFIDHVAQAIHADAVIESVARELDQVIDHLFPEPIGDAAEVEEDADAAVAELAEQASESVIAGAGGYLRFINGDALIDLAVAHDLLIRVEATPGQFVVEGDVVATVHAPAAISEDVAGCVRAAIVLGVHRTPMQDAPFAFEQLTEMALRALSPGVNDPITAIHCIDRIGSGLSRLVSRRLPSPLRRDDEGRVRVVARPVGLEAILDGTVGWIARHADRECAVWLRLGRVLEKAFERARREPDRAALIRRAESIATRAEGRLEPGESERLRAALRWSVEG